MKDADYYMGHLDEFEKLSQEEQAQVFVGGAMPQGDTEGQEGDPAAKESEGEPNPAEAKTDTEPEETGKEAEPAKEEPVVLAKDGKHTIPYSELVESREKARQLEDLVKNQEAIIADLKAAKEQDAETGGTEAQDKVVAEYQGEYPEVFADLKPFLESVAGKGDAKIKVLEDKIAELEAKIAPVEQAAARTEVERWWEAVQEKHPDATELVSNGKLEAWIATQPSFTRKEYERVFNKSTVAETVEMLDAFRKDNPKTSAPHQTKEEIAKVAQEKAAKAKLPVPASLSDVPGATAAHHDEAAAMLEMNPMALANKFMAMDPDKIEATLSRLM